jgi:hypothetical protein
MTPEQEAIVEALRRFLVSVFGFDINIVITEALNLVVSDDVTRKAFTQAAIDRQQSELQKQLDVVDKDAEGKKTSLDAMIKLLAGVKL